MTKTASRVLPSPSDEHAWTNPSTIPEIVYWQDTVDPAAHRLAHPTAIQGCPGCPPVTACDWCGLTPDACSDLAGHRRLATAGEATCAARAEVV